MIDIFWNENKYLSNFYISPVSFEGWEYWSVEHAYQSIKTLDLEWRKKVQECSTPGKAKRIGLKVPMRPDWETIKYDVMRALVLQKFTNHLDIREKLLATGDQELIEENTWGDKIWGQVKNAEGVYEGQNLLGKILMSVREELKNFNVKEI